MKHIQLSIEDNIATICFDRSGSTANIFDYDVLTELDEAVDIVEQNHQLKGLIIHSAKPSIFIAGADIKTLATAPISEIRSLINLGQTVFDRIADLDIPTVAAIHGACVGGGYELALACDWRISSDESCTKIGLPEVQLGLLPAWGGSTRLPALIGLTKALSIILGAKLYKAKSAKQKELIDVVCPKPKLLSLARRYTRKGKRKFTLHFTTHNPISIAFIKNKAKNNILKKTRGHYPAPLKALEVICKGILASHLGSLHYESAAFLELVRTPQTKQLIRLFFLTEKQKKLPIAKAAKKKIANTAIIGAGIMGSGIAYWTASRKINTTLKDISAEAVAKGLGNIEKITSQSVKRRILTKTEGERLLDRISYTHEDVDFFHKDLIIEAAIENLDIKKKILNHLSNKTKSQCILATNTSALPITELAKCNSSPERVIGLHFFNPVPRMKLVEVVKTNFTSNEVLANAVAFVSSIGKLPVVVSDSPGFLVNRILMPYLVAAGEMFTNGINPIEIDNKILDFGMPMGPFRLLDEVGLDVALHVATTLSNAFPNRMRTPLILKQLCEAGCLGRKTSRGFYDYSTKTNETFVNPIARDFQSNTLLNIQAAAEKLIHQMSDEAQRCLEEGIAASADEIDFAMVMGTGYAPFRGGPLQHSKNAGLKFLHTTTN